MILGIGTDLVDIASFAEQFDQPGTRFAEAFTGTEHRMVRARARVSGRPMDHYAVRWAVKEAVIKAWSGALYGVAPPVDPAAVVWSDIEVIADAYSRPGVHLRGGIAAAVAESLGSLDALAWHVSTSHDAGIATATVLLERRASADLLGT